MSQGSLPICDRCDSFCASDISDMFDEADENGRDLVGVNDEGGMQDR